MHLIPRAFVRQPSGRHLDLLNPSPDGWTDEDLAIGLSRTYRWGGHSIWPWPLSVAQHSLSVLGIYKRLLNRPPSAAEMLRELLHDADEALIGGFDPISPLKPLLGEGYTEIVSRLQAAVFRRYGVSDWMAEEHKLHKRADHLAAASEAIHVAGWSLEEVQELLNIGCKPLKFDPLQDVYCCEPWKPWPPEVAAEMFLDELRQLQVHID
ncbi:phosphohydrolase (plasmid) [Acidovorax carolinensis]|uniref:Phosphohydrolase n=2 Tax=Acidovorax carolinensis TaxID=553814 RepID=A0A240UJZ5_9BURK|nr:phosphohydrolase [Acidovorax carolinensis]ART61446.1 phosphohydrolase [Acidovorax carolinensis]